MTRSEILSRIERCDREIENCGRCFDDPTLSESDKRGATQGDADWRCERVMYLAMLTQEDSELTIQSSKS